MALVLYSIFVNAVKGFISTIARKQSIALVDAMKEMIFCQKSEKKIKPGIFTSGFRIN